MLTDTVKCSSAKLDRIPKFKPASSPRFSIGMRSMLITPDGAPPVNAKVADALFGFWLKV